MLVMVMKIMPSGRAQYGNVMFHFGDGDDVGDVGDGDGYGDVGDGDGDDDYAK